MWGRNGKSHAETQRRSERLRKDETDVLEGGEAPLPRVYAVGWRRDEARVTFLNSTSIPQLYPHGEIRFFIRFLPYFVYSLIPASPNNPDSAYNCFTSASVSARLKIIAQDISPL